MGNQWDGPGQKRTRIKGGAPVYRGQARGSQRAGGHKPPKKGSGGGSKATVFIAVGLLMVPLSAIGGVAAWLLHGYGVI